MTTPHDEIEKRIFAPHHYALGKEFWIAILNLRPSIITIIICSIMQSTRPKCLGVPTYCMSIKSQCCAFNKREFRRQSRVPLPLTLRTFQTNFMNPDQLNAGTCKEMWMHRIQLHPFTTSRNHTKNCLNRHSHLSQPLVLHHSILCIKEQQTRSRPDKNHYNMVLAYIMAVIRTLGLMCAIAPTNSCVSMVPSPSSCQLKLPNISVILTSMSLFSRTPELSWSMTANSFMRACLSASLNSAAGPV
mmetsp:Transcript_34800/g.58055  ORF Transcript_34800/g.58055 Transcript_34800/m.58055 type:complete len:245 (+) Transcript_34800:279-1013(+)